MASCPSCGSKKIYQGYRTAPLLYRIFRLHEFLCEGCNLQFRAFSFKHPRRKTRRQKPPVESLFIIRQQETAPSSAAASSASQLSAGGSLNTGVAVAPPASNVPDTSQLTAKMREWKAQAQQGSQSGQRRNYRSHHNCPQCGSTDTERRRRKLWERVVFYFSQIRAYQCRICGTDFYARRKRDQSTAS